MEFFFFLGATILFLLSWTPTLLSLLLYDFLYGPALRASLFLTATLIMGGLLYLIVKKELRSVEFIITDMGIIKRTPYKIKMIAYKDITGVRRYRIPLVRGCAAITSGKQVVLLPCPILHFQSLLGSLQKELVQRQCPSFTPEQVESLEREAEHFRAAQERIKHALPFVTGWILLTPVFSLFTAVACWKMELVPSIAWAVSSLLFPVMGYFAAERQFEYNAGKHENFIYHKAGLVTFLAYCICGIAFKHLL
jgi:hypothetical protein